MDKTKKYHGVIVPVITPFEEDGSIDEKAAVQIAEFLLEGGGTLFFLGTTGEVASMSVEMRFQFLSFMMKELSRMEPGVVYAGISDNALEHSVEAAKRYHDLGADVFVAHLPSYYPITSDAMMAYYEQLADQSPGPIMLYNVPGTTKLSIPIEVIQNLSDHPNIIGLKDSGRDLDRLQTLVDMYKDREDFALMCGWTLQSTKTLLMGFDGIVPSTANVIPGKFKELYDAVQAGDEATALELQSVIDPIAEFHQKDRTVSWAIAGLKVMLEELGLCQPWVRLPVVRLESDDETQLRERTQKHIIEAGLR